MKILDSIYGEFEIEPIFENLIKTKEVQRLKLIHQGGANYLINPKWNVTRYEHSIGTMLFIRLMGGTIEEQIAGLFHDISHTAFSHVIDYALKNEEENYHEKIYDKIIKGSDIPKILLKNGYNYEDILFNEAKWTILEKEAPKLCADRIDYTLRDMYHYGYISKKEVNSFLSDLHLVNGEVVVTSIKGAEWFVTTYYKEVIDYFMNPIAIYANDRLTKALKIALALKEITLEDFLKDDNYVYKRLEASPSEEIRKLLDDLKIKVHLRENKDKYDIYQKQKLRIIDPTIIIDNKLYKTSDKSKSAKALTEDAIKKAQRGAYIQVIK